MSELEVRFIRHAKGAHMLRPELIVGRSVYVELIEEGWDQAKAKGLELAERGVSPDYVVSSSAVRCIQTGTKILETMKHAGELDDITDELLEIDQGDFVGRNRNEVYNEQVLRQIAQQGKDFALPGGESMNQVGERGVNWLKTQETSNKRSILAIAHAGLIAFTVGTLQNWDHTESFTKLRQVPPVSETRLVFDGEQWQLDYFGQPVQK